jgi:hypothetical protein
LSNHEVRNPERSYDAKLRCRSEAEARSSLSPKSLILGSFRRPLPKTVTSPKNNKIYV